MELASAVPPEGAASAEDESAEGGLRRRDLARGALEGTRSRWRT